MCWNFTAGNCELGDDLCWFSHKNQSDGHKSLNCKICGNIFNAKNDLHCHMKHEHKMSVPLCKNASKNTCWYGAENCWFRHEQTEKIIIKVRKLQLRFLVLVQLPPEKVRPPPFKFS